MTKKHISYLIILLFLPIIFLILFGRFGLEDSDSGFLVGMGWRILNGETPYKDFYYVRPIASPFISAFWLYILPEFSQVLMMRLINYYQLVLQVLMTVLTLNKYYNFKELKLNVYLFSIVSVLITSIGTTYFQWHTTDGIFFAILGFFLISSLNTSNLIFLIIAGMAFGISALTKQNFILAPILGILFTLLQHGLKKSLVVLLGVVTTFLIFYCYIYYYDVVGLFTTQTTGSTSFKDLFRAGFIAYFTGSKYLLLYIFLSLSFFAFLSFFIKISLWKIAFLSFLSALVGMNSAAFLLMDSSPRLVYFDNIIPITIVYAFVFLLFLKKEKLSDHYIAIALLGVTWASSISWGSMSPLMFFTPVLFASYYLLQKYLNIFDSKINLILIALISTYTLVTNSKPYRDLHVWEISKDAAQISSKLSFIKINSSTFKKHLELKEVFKKYDETTILPSMPGAYYIHSQINYLPIDWAMDVEVAFDQQGLLSRMEDCCKYYIVEKKALGQPIGTEGKFYSSVTDYLISNYTLLDSSYEFFDIYTK